MVETVAQQGGTTLAQDPYVLCRDCGARVGEIVAGCLRVRHHKREFLMSLGDPQAQTTCEKCGAVWRPPALEEQARVETAVRRAIAAGRRS